jgi:hypothetical protein
MTPHHAERTFRNHRILAPTTATPSANEVRVMYLVVVGLLAAVRVGVDDAVWVSGSIGMTVWV